MIALVGLALGLMGPPPDGDLAEPELELEPDPVRYPNAEENVLVGERRPVRLGLPDLDGG